MLSENHVALKEWAILCEALGHGRQQILFRKGGIHEGPEGFQPEHSEFWLFPTNFHQGLEGVRSEFHAEVSSWNISSGREEEIWLQQYAVIQSVHWIEDPQRLARLSQFHILTDAAIAKRFEYRHPGLFVLVVNVWQLPEPVKLPADVRYEGCHSWVELNEAVSTAGLQPVTIGDADAQGELQKILSTSR